MDGLECSEIMLSELEFSGRIDAEYYQKKYLQYQEMVQKRNGCQMGQICHFLIGPFGSAYDTSDYVDTPDYRYVRGQDVKPFFLQDTSPKYMAKEDYIRLKKYALQEGDVLLSVVGTLGNACIVQGQNLPAIFSCKSTAIRTDDIDPYFLLAYLNSRYGRQLLLRKERGAVQKGLNLDDLKSLDIPLLSSEFQKKIRSTSLNASKAIVHATEKYKIAQDCLFVALKWNTVIMATSAITRKRFSESFAISGRLDAEYYQPKYDDYYTLISAYPGGWSTVGKEFSHVNKKCTRTKKTYDYVEIGDVDVGMGIAMSNRIDTADLPDNAKIITRKGDIIVSTVRPNRGAVAILANNDLLVSGAFTVLREVGSYKKEVLQVLLRTELYRDWLLRYNVGTSYPVIKDNDVLNMPIPLLPNGLQNEIAQKVRESFSLRRQSEKLIETAVRAVEIAIERDEAAAVEWLNEANAFITGEGKYESV